MNTSLRNFTHMPFKLAKLFLPVLFCFAVPDVNALTRTWIGYGAGGTATKTDIAAAANWSGGTALLSTDDYVMTFNGTLGTNGSTTTFTLIQSAALTFKSLTITFVGNGNGQKTVVVNTSKPFSITNALTITNNTNSGNADHEIDFNVTASTVTCGSVVLNANGMGGLFGYPQLYLNVSNAASLICSGAFTTSCSSSSFTYTNIENYGTITMNGTTTASSQGYGQIYFDVNNGGVFNLNGTASLGASGNTGVFLSTLNPGTSTGKFYFRDNLTFGSLGFVDPLYNPQSYTFDGTGTQTVSVATSNVYFSNLIIGELNAPTVNFTGAGNASLTASASSANLTVNNSSILNLSTKTLNRSSAGGTLSLNNSATLKLAGTTGGQTGSNFPLNFSTVTLNNTSTVEYNGANATTQTVFATPTYGNLSLTNSTGSGTAAKNISSNLTVTNTLTFNDRISFTIPSTKSVTLKSTSTLTARVAEIVTPATVTLTYSGSGSTRGKFIVERYISAVKGWRFLAVPTNSTEYIHDAWQEGQAANNTSLSGKGIQLTSNSFPNGFDLYTTSSSLKTYAPVSNTWAGVTSTLAPFNASLGGYMTFIRGDRTVNSFAQAPTATVLRTSGQLYVGNQTYAATTANRFVAISNPYASALDFSKIYLASTNIDQVFYVYDPKAGTPGIGGYQTITKIAGVWKAIPGGGSYPSSGAVNPNIESGQAFFVYSTTGSGSVSIKENSKLAGGNLVSRETTSDAVAQGLHTSIYTVNADSSVGLSDGIYNDFDDNFSNEVDKMDVRKSSNFGLNLSIRRNNNLLVVDRTKPVSFNDTIFFNLAGVKVQRYRFEFVADNLSLNGMQAYLEDNYLNTRNPIDLSDTTRVDFNVINVPGSYAADRFRIVFVKPMATLPVSITSIAANRNSNMTIKVDWKVENELNMAHYETERSSDGRTFTAIVSTVAKENNRTGAYSIIDNKPLSADNFYRIKAVSVGGQVQYSAIVKVAAPNEQSALTVYPNPVTGKIINVRFHGQPAGNYSLQLTNTLGQMIYQKNIQLTEINTTKSIAIDTATPAGIYQLLVRAEDGTTSSIPISIN
ncbi:MAG: T9SS type A sorting domain-containing protein [Ferruginibacter sp.]